MLFRTIVLPIVCDYCTLFNVSLFIKKIKKVNLQRDLNPSLFNSYPRLKQALFALCNYNESTYVTGKVWVQDPQRLFYFKV